METPLVSVIIRTHNEIHLIETLISKINEQDYENFEVIVVDSGSNDGTVEAAEKLKAKVVHIKDEDFTFGYSLNVGCEAARGEILAFISGHCYPVDKQWMRNIVTGFGDQSIACVFGRQKGDHRTKFSERQIFSQYFGTDSKNPYKYAFCNNANNSIRKSFWEKIPFDESLTGLEDIDWNLRMHKMGGKAAYSAETEIYHIHSETWLKIRHRFRREAVAMKNMFPKHSMPLIVMINLLFRAILGDLVKALIQKEFSFIEILKYRYNQYLGAYLGFKYMEDRPLPQRVFDKWEFRDPISSQMKLSNKNTVFILQSLLIAIISSILSVWASDYGIITGIIIISFFIWVSLTTKPKETIDLDDLSYKTIFEEIRQN